jgi:hypothetical protein
MIILHGVGQAIAAIDAKVAAMHAATRAATAKALHVIERSAKQKLTTSTHELGTPTPSAPGEPPSLVTGNLRRSITVTGPDPAGPGMWKGSVGPTAIYGRIQELGGITRGRTLPARPYMEPALHDVLDEIERIFAEAWTGAILS